MFSMKNPHFIPQTDPKASYVTHNAEIDQAISRVLDSGWYILGEEAAAFEQAFADYLGVGYAVAVSSGTDALHLALRTCGIGPGDGVITVSHTAVATVAAVELSGATPILVDIEPATYTIDPECVESLLGTGTTIGRPKAIVPVHLYGQSADMPAILDIAQRHDLYVIEDCAQAHGATLGGRQVGTWGHVAAYSFYPTKNLGALGDAGLVATNDAQLAARVRSLREYGWEDRHISHLPGFNCRMDAIQAAVLRVKLRHLDSENERRRGLAQRYDSLLAHTEMALPQTRPQARHVYHQYVVNSRHRDSLRAYLTQAGVETLIHYPVPVHLQPAYQGRLPQLDSLQRTEEAAHRILSLPMFPQLTDSQAERVGQVIIRWHRRAAERS